MCVSCVCVVESVCVCVCMWRVCVCVCVCGWVWVYVSTDDYSFIEIPSSAVVSLQLLPVSSTVPPTPPERSVTLDL